jgi:hypothetical protein
MGIGSPFNQQMLSALSSPAGGSDTQIAKPSDELQSRGMQGGDQSLLKQYLSQLGPQTQPPAPGSQSTSTFRSIEPEGWPYNMGDRSQPLNPPPTIIPGSLGGYGSDTPAIPAQTGNPMTQQLVFPGGQNNSTQSGMGGSSTQVGGSSGGGGKQSLSIGQVGLTFDPSGGGATKMMASGGIASLGAGNMEFMRPAMGGASQQETVREIDIINSYFRQANIPPEQGIQILQAAVKAGVTFKRSGNTILVSQPLPPNAAKVYFFALDKGEAFTRAVVELLGGLKQQGVQMVYLNKVDPVIVKTLQDIGLQTQQSDRQDYKIMAAL